jgi:hypothetical protein
MKTFDSLLAALASQGTLAANAAADALVPLLLAWERESANGKPAHELLSDIDGVIALLLGFQRQAAHMLFTSVPCPALQQVGKFEAGNDYRLDPTSGETGVWIEMGSVVAHVSNVGGRVAVGLHANHELCTDEPLESCVLLQHTARAFIEQSLRESEVPT